MKKIYSLIAALLFVGSMMAEVTTTYTFSSKAWGASPANWTSGKDGNQMQSGRGIQITTGATGANGTSPVSFTNVSKVVVTYSTNANAGAGSIAVQVGSNTAHSQDVTKTGGTTDRTLTYNISPYETGKVKVTVTCSTNSIYVKSVAITTMSSTAAVATPEIEGEEVFFDETDVTITCSTTGAAIYYTLDGTTPTASSTPYAAFKLTETKTVKAIAIKGDDESEVAEMTFTKAPVYATIDALVAAGLSTGSKMVVSFSDVEIKGIFTINAGNRRGIFVDVQAGGKDVEIYYGSNDVPAEWAVGGTVSGTIKGTWTNYNGQWEIIPTTAGWKWTDLTYEAPSSSFVLVDPATINAPAAGKSGTIDVTYTNIDDLTSAVVAFYEADGTTPATYAWLTAELNADKDVEYVVAANTDSEARSAYLKVQVGDIRSELVTISQAGYVPDYATLPFEFDGGKSAIETTAGLTQSGLGNDYSASPKLKFDGTDDNLILKFNEDAGKLTFDIKGNSFSGGTFKVQTSADGETYTDLETYTELGDTQSEEFTIAAGVRYIKWIYTNKSSGNVALGNIALTKASGTALDNAAVEGKAVKFIENGQLFIEKAGVRYNVMGQAVK